MPAMLCLHNARPVPGGRPVARGAVVDHREPVPALVVYEREVVFGVLLAPAGQRADHDPEAVALRRKHVVGARRMVAVVPPRDDPSRSSI